MDEESKLAARVTRLLCERIRWATNLHEDSAFLNSEARLAKYVLALAKSQGRQSDVGVKIQIPQSDLARFLGVSRKTVNQYLHSWREQGWVQIARTRLIIRDPYALRRLAAGSNDGCESTD